MTGSEETIERRPDRRLLGLTAALLALQVLNLAVFDDLRTDESVGAFETFTKPQHVSSIVAVLLAVILVVRTHRHAARVAVGVAWIEIAAFTFFHGIPVQIGPAKPYWGEGSGDALQWVGFLTILACSVAIVLVGRQGPRARRHRTDNADRRTDQSVDSHALT
jgi:DMSO/TMAO reductase YedYZ heme-binding membrane subunit